ncbi:MAG: HAD family phosphatase [Pseudoflavonifractor sp.]|nr:HAD family phosphatase [Pseudoflavonifractor sp.]
MIFFDLDGTLIDSNGVWVQIDLDFLSRRGLTPTAEYSDTVAHSIFPAAARFTRDYYGLSDSPEDIMAQWRDMAYDAYAHTIPLKPGARALLEGLSARGEPMALLTASLPELCRAALDRHGLNRYFRGAFFAQEAGLEKRDPAVYPLAAERFGFSPHGCVLLEDAPDNCAAASAAGLTVVGVYDDFYAPRWADVVEHSSRTVHSLEELLPDLNSPVFPLTTSPCTGLPI